MKVHLLSVPDPAMIAGDAVADCTATVKHAREVCMWDGQAMGQQLEIPSNVCRKCVKAGKSERYTFGIVDGESLQQEGSDGE